MKILFLEDNLDFAGPLIEAAQELGHEVQHTQSIIDASKIFTHKNFDAVISDIHLKSDSDFLTSGLDFIRFIRERKKSNIVVAVTTGMELIQEHDVKDYGIDIFYHKPITVGFTQFFAEIEKKVNHKRLQI